MGKVKDQLKKIIFGTETFGGRLFDVLLIFAIITSVLIVMLDSVTEYHNSYGDISTIQDKSIILSIKKTINQNE